VNGADELIGKVCVTGALSLCLLAEPARLVAADWSAIAETKAIYTNDVFAYSAARRLALSEDPSQPTITPLDRPQDLIWEPSLEAIRASASQFGRTEVSVRAVGSIYTEHPIFNHGNYYLRLVQQLDPASEVRFRYRYNPNLFLGPNFSRQTPTRTIQEERVTSHLWRMELERRLAEPWAVILVARYGLRFYNQAFAERDTQLWSLGPEVTWRARTWMTFALAYLYERGLADGRDQPQFADDVSYRQHFVYASNELQLLARLSLKLEYIFRVTDFTTVLAGDPNQGRVDFTHQGLAELRYQLTRPILLTLAYQKTERSSNRAAAEFNTTNVLAGVRYTF
jgi:hypothetical protein